MAAITHQAMISALVAVSIVAGVSLGGDDQTARKQKIETIDDLWAGFDPEALALDIEVVKSWDEGDVHLESIYFTGEEFEGKKDTSR